MKTTFHHFLHGAQTGPGKWSIGLIIAMPILFLIGTTSMSILYPAIPAGNSILEDLAARPALAISMLAGMAAGIAAFFTGFVGITKQHDRSVFVYLSTIIGALLLLFLLGEIISPH